MKITMYYQHLLIIFSIIVIVSCVCAVKQASAQAGPAATAIDEIKPLKIGDKVPDELWDRYFPVVSAGNDQTQMLSLGDYRDKLIILDFWATWCAPCISSLYKLDTLQKEFKDDLMIIPTSYEPEEKVRKFFKEKGLQLPTAFEETLLKKYFPHKIIPHQVWVKDGKVLSIAQSANATPSNIQKVLNGEFVEAFVKSERERFDPKEPLFVLKDSIESRVLYNRGVSGYIKGVTGRVTRLNDNSLSALNLSVLQLYRIAFEDSIKFIEQFNRVIVRLNDSLKTKVVPPPDLKLTGEYANDKNVYEWKEKNQYCYALTYPENFPTELRSQLVKEDLNTFFGYHLGIIGKLRNERIKCLVFSIGEKQAKQVVKLKDSDVAPIDLNLYLGQILFANRTEKIPMVNEIRNYEGIDVYPASDLTDLNAVRESLRSYGILLKEDYRNIDVLIISEIDKH